MSSVIFVIVGAVLVAFGVWGVAALDHPLRKLLALNIAGSGIFLIIVASAARDGVKDADPVPHALVLTGLVVAVSATAVGLTLMLRVFDTARGRRDSRRHDRTDP